MVRSLKRVDTGLSAARPASRRAKRCVYDDGAPIELRLSPEAMALGAAVAPPEPPVAAPLVPVPSVAGPPPVFPAPAPPPAAEPMPVPAPPPAERMPTPPLAPANPMPTPAPPPAEPMPAPSPPPAEPLSAAASDDQAPRYGEADDERAVAAAFAEDLKSILTSAAGEAAAQDEDGFLDHAAKNARQSDPDGDDEQAEAQGAEPPRYAAGHEVFDRLTYATQFDAGRLPVADLDEAFAAFDAEAEREARRREKRAERGALAQAAAAAPTREPTTMETVEDLADISPPAEAQSGPQSFSVRYDVQLVPQLTDMSCWAAGAAMLVGFRERMSVDPSEVARAAGYWAQYKDGLHPTDTQVLENVWGLKTEQAQTYTVEGFRELLETYGPLWTAGAEPAPHIRVVAGMVGDGTPDGTRLTILDPQPVGTGSRYEETYRQYERKQRELGHAEKHLQGIYVAHIREPLPADDPRRQR